MSTQISGEPIAWGRAAKWVGGLTLGTAVFEIGTATFLSGVPFGTSDGAVWALVLWLASSIAILVLWARWFIYRAHRRRSARVAERSEMTDLAVVGEPTERRSRWLNGLAGGSSTLLPIVALLSLGPAVASGEDVISAYVLQVDGRQVIAEVARSETTRGVRLSIPHTYYYLRHLDGTPISGRFSGPERLWPVGHRLLVVESRSGLVNPRVPEALDPTRPLTIFVTPLALQAASYALLVLATLGYRPDVRQTRMAPRGHLRCKIEMTEGPHHRRGRTRHERNRQGKERCRGHGRQE